ncbi:MAG: xylose isomerase protein [Bacilli bacterium]|nr:xylose isomerase protein [Bacilli bacterium]
MKGLINKLGIMSYVYQGYTAKEMASAIQSHGLNYVQLDPRQSELLEGDVFSVQRASEIKQIFDDHGIEIIALSGYINLLDPILEKREANLSVLERLIELCQAFGTKFVATETGSFHPTNQWRYHPDNDSEFAWEALLKSVDRLRTKAAEHRAVFLLEGYVTNVVSSPERARLLIDQLGTDGLGFILDPFNYMTESYIQHQEEALDQVFQLIGAFSPIAHAKDAIYTEKGFDSPRAGTGSMNWQLVASKMAQQTPDLPLILEHLTAEEVEETLNFIKGKFAEAVR